jgi:hypothetical protein
MKNPQAYDGDVESVTGTLAVAVRTRGLVAPGGTTEPVPVNVQVCVALFQLPE